MLKTYAVGLLAGLVLALAVAGVYVATEPDQETGLLWGGIVYDSKQEFNGYLKSKGLSYKIWLQRNPGVAPWEPSTQASSEPSTRLRSPRVPLAVILVAVASGFAFLLVARQMRPVLARVPAGIGGLPSRRRRAAGLGNGLPVGASLRRPGVLASSAAGRFEAGVASLARLSRRLGGRRRRPPAQSPRLSLENAVGTAAPSPASDGDVIEALRSAASAAAPRRGAEPEAPKAKPDLPLAPGKETNAESKVVAAADGAALNENRVSTPEQKPLAPPSQRVVPAKTRPRRTTREPAVRPVSAPAAVLAPAVRDRRSARECEIHSWRGYVMSEFLAIEVTPDGLAATIATSPPFRWRRREAPHETPEAADALRALVATLEGEGWTVAERGERWFAFRLRLSSSPERADTAGGGDGSSTVEEEEMRQSGQTTLA
jgi:hypothetical protein